MLKGTRTVKFRSLLILATMLATTAHFVRAEGKFFFSDRNDSDYVRVKSKRGSDLFVFDRCSGDEPCASIGKKDGYTLEEIRIPLFKLMAKRELGSLTSVEARDLDTLQEIIDGIEQPNVNFQVRTYSHHFKISVDQFSRVVDDRINASIAEDAAPAPDPSTVPAPAQALVKTSRSS